MIAHGAVTGARDGLVQAQIAGVAIGDRVCITSPCGPVNGIVSALHGRCATVSADEAIDGIAAGCDAYVTARVSGLPFGTALLGRAIDPRYGADLPAAPHPAQRVPLASPFWTGLRVIDGLLTIACGARIGLFGPPATGKSTLLHALVRGANADAIVVGLCGERGREAEEWMRIAPAHASIVCATGDCSARKRIAAAHTAVLQADALRARGLQVLLVLDSLARYANALREVAIAAGEPAGRGGFPATVFAQLARYVEVAGSTRRGSLTLVATVLSDGDERDPVSDSARSLLDGHVQLSPTLASAGRFPAIDVLQSNSRTMPAIASDEHLAASNATRRALALLERTADARSLGIEPVEPDVLRAIAVEKELEVFLRQSVPVSPAETLSALAALADTLK